MLIGAVARLRTVLAKSMKDKAKFYFDQITDYQITSNFLDELSLEIIKIKRQTGGVAKSRIEDQDLVTFFKTVFVNEKRKLSLHLFRNETERVELNS